MADGFPPYVTYMFFITLKSPALSFTFYTFYFFIHSYIFFAFCVSVSIYFFCLSFILYFIFRILLLLYIFLYLLPAPYVAALRCSEVISTILW